MPRNLITQLLLRPLQKHGLVYKHYTTPERFYKKVGREPPEVRRYELRKITYDLRMTRHHEIYNRLLHRFVTKWPVGKIREARFIGNGIGGESLNSYRKIQSGNGAYFEKVYFSSDPALRVLSWFYNYIYAYINTGLNIPKMVKAYRGEVLTIVYFEYFKLFPVEKTRRAEALIRVSKYLYRASSKWAIETKACPNFIKDFVGTNEVYKKNRPLAQEKFIEQNLNMAKIEEKVKASKLVLTHGDINRRNIFGDNVVIDWDNFGIYPIGMDPALTYYYLLKRNEVDSDLTNWLTKNFENMIEKADWSDFKRNSMYFLYVFGQSFLFSKKKYHTLEKELIRGLKAEF